MEDLMDRLFTGCRLTTDVLNMSGPTGTQPTHYMILHHIFTKMVSISNADAIIDVGCGEGRVLAYLHRRFPRVSLAGVDFNEASIAVARRWARERGISLYCQDALTLDYQTIDRTFAHHDGITVGDIHMVRGLALADQRR